MWYTFKITRIKIWKIDGHNLNIIKRLIGNYIGADAWYAALNKFDFAVFPVTQVWSKKEFKWMNEWMNEWIAAVSCSCDMAWPGGVNPCIWSMG